MGLFSDSTGLKLRYILSYILMMNISYFSMPVKVYRSMMMTEFYIYNTLFLSYTYTYPCSYRLVLLITYELAILVSLVMI